MVKPTINKKKCNCSLNCIEVCPVGVFEKKNGCSVVAHPENCIGCMACEVSCPKKAIKVK